MVEKNNTRELHPNNVKEHRFLYGNCNLGVETAVWVLFLEWNGWKA